MESLSQGDSSANSSDPDDELGPPYINESGLARILGRMTGHAEVMPVNPTAPLLPACRQYTRKVPGERLSESSRFP